VWPTKLQSAKRGASNPHLMELLCNDRLATSLCTYTDKTVCDSHVIFSHTRHMLVTVGKFNLNSLTIVISLVAMLLLFPFGFVVVDYVHVARSHFAIVLSGTSAAATVKNTISFLPMTF
jgi:hypothetical protein